MALSRVKGARAPRTALRRDAVGNDNDLEQVYRVNFFQVHIRGCVKYLSESFFIMDEPGDKVEQDNTDHAHDEATHADFKSYRVGTTRALNVQC